MKSHSPLSSPHFRRYCKECGNVTQIQFTKDSGSILHSLALVILTGALTSSIIMAILGRN